MNPLIVFLAITGGIVWAAAGAIAIAMLLFWLVDKRDDAK